MDINWDDLKTILLVVREGNLSRAATRMGINYTTIARRISRAEARLGARLFERLSDGYRPTELGRLVAGHAARMEDEEHALSRVLSGRDETLRGSLTVTAPQLLIQTHLVHVIDLFYKSNPQVDLQINSAHDILDLTRRQADLAVRVSNQPGDDLTGVRLAKQMSASFASPQLAKRIEDNPGDPVDWVLWSGASGVPKASLPQYPDARVRARFDDMVSMIGAAQAGLGVVRMPMFLGRAMPGLVQVPVLPPQPYADIWVVAHADVWPGAKVTAFRKLLVAYFRQHRGRFTAGDA